MVYQSWKMAEIKYKLLSDSLQYKAFYRDDFQLHIEYIALGYVKRK